jgi:mannitol operon transcriptional antiterminator
MVLLPNIAVLHAHPDDGVRQLCISVTTLKTPVEFGHEANDPVKVAVVVAAIDNHSHIQALRELVGVLESDDRRSQVIGAATVSELREVLLSRPAQP